MSLYLIKKFLPLSIVVNYVQVVVRATALENYSIVRAQGGGEERM